MSSLGWLGLLACGWYGKPPDVFLDGGPPPPRKLGVVALADTVLLTELEGLDGEASFRHGVYVGNVTMRGGFVTEEDPEYGLQVRAKEYSFSAQAQLAGTAADWSDQAFAELLQDGGVTYRRAPVQVPAPIRHRSRGTHEADGTDNVNLPRFTLEPSPLAPGSAPGADQVLVPIVVSYYSHNGGWFLGQEYGCGMGARLRVLWALYDSASGAPIAWGEVDAREIDSRVASPSSAQLEDALLKVEATVAKELGKQIR